MLTLNDRNILACWMPIDGREFTRYFSGFPITSLDQEVICYHKKQIIKKNWKDVWSGVEIFMCRPKDFPLERYPLNFFNYAVDHGKLLIRNDEIAGCQVSIPMTGTFMWKEQEFTTMVTDLWAQWYIVNQSLIQTKDFPLIQWSITDPRLLETIVGHFKEIEKGKDLSTIITQLDRRDKVVAELIDWCWEQDLKGVDFDEYDIALIQCDS